MKLFFIRKYKVLYVIGVLLVFGAVLVLSSALGGGFSPVMAKTDLKPIYKVDTKDKKIAISFDAAWGADKTASIMDICDRYKVHATFFLVGFWIDKYPDMVKQIAQRGFEIGNHSLNHPKMVSLTPQQMRQEIEEVNNKIQQLTGKTPDLFRPPFGSYDNIVVQTVRDLNMHCIQWSIDSLDWQEKGIDEMVERVTKKPENGSIILFHNNARYIVDALPKILENLQKKGYTIVSIGELIYKENYKVDQQGVQHKG